MNDVAFRELVSGRKSGLCASVVRTFLWMLSVPYRMAVAIRSCCYSIGVLPEHKVKVSVVSVGNLTVGGTGKTPIVAFLANWCREQGLRPAIVSRGYKALDTGENDEKLVLDILCPDVPHVQNPDRVQAARQAIEQFDAKVVIADDAFQHRRLGRMLDIVLVDATNPFGYGHLLPRGLLREPVAAIRRADVVVLTRVDQADKAAVQRVHDSMKPYTADDAHVESQFVLTGFRNIAGNSRTVEDIVPVRTFAFCAIGNPIAFQNSLRKSGIQPIGFGSFPDHHHYSAKDLDELRNRAAECEADELVTTLKDLVKIKVNHIGDMPLWAAEIGTKITQGEQHLLDALGRLSSDS